MAYPTFPELSRQPALKTKTSSDDPTLRDKLENGMEATRAKFRRRRRTFAFTTEHLTADDLDKLEYFVVNVAVFGANIFFFPNTVDRRNPVNLLVRFAVIPKYDGEKWAVDQIRQDTTFELREV